MKWNGRWECRRVCSVESEETSSTSFQKRSVWTEDEKELVDDEVQVVTFILIEGAFER